MIRSPQTLEHEPYLKNEPLSILSSDVMRRLVDQSRVRAKESEYSFAVIEVDLREADVQAHRLFDFSLNGTYSDLSVGWLSDEKFAFLLPDTSSEDATKFAIRLTEQADLQPVAVTLHVPNLDNFQPHPALKTGLSAERFSYDTPKSKRILDIVVASALLIAASPILVLAAIAIKMTSRGPVLFRQKRVGMGETPFWMYKLRTMHPDAEQQRAELESLNEVDGLGFKIKKDPRLTPIGAFLRRSSMDEIPQLINVLKGEMSLVGPRPLPCSDWKPAEGWYTLRHDVIPGVTCSWQVMGRNEIAFDEWMKLDLEYVRNRSWKTDLELLIQTIPAVLRRKGAA